MWRSRRRSDRRRTRVENSLLVRFSITTLLAALIAAVAVLIAVRRWADLEMTVLVAALLAAGLFVIFMSPEAIVIDDDSVRDRSGWRRTGWSVRRDDVAQVRWEQDPDLFDPPRLVFVGHQGEILESAYVEFSPEAVLAALRDHHWPIADAG